MAKKLSSVLGIDVGSHRIKVCEMRAQGREPVITALGIVDTPEGAVDHTGIYNSDAVGTAIKQAISESGATSSNIVITIAGQASVLVRTLEVPRMNPVELKEHMQWEINRNIPFAENTIVSDYKLLPDEDPTSQNIDVVMAIAPQSAIDTTLACIKRAGKQVAAIDVEPLSMARSIQSSYDDVLYSKTVCIVDVGHKTTSINIYRGSKLLMPRQVPVGGEMFTKAIADALTINVREAEQLKIEKCEVPEGAAESGAVSNPFDMPGSTQEFQPYNPFSDDPMPAHAVPEPTDVTVPPTPNSTLIVSDNPEGMQLYHAIAPILDEFVAEVRRSIDYFRSRGGEVDQIELCGGGSKLKGLSQFLEKSVGVACDAYDPMRRLNVNAKKVTADFVDEHRQEFSVAVGNGLYIFFD